MNISSYQQTPIITQPQKSMMNFKEYIENKDKNDTYENFIEYKTYEFDSMINSVKDGDSMIRKDFKLYNKNNVDEIKKDSDNYAKKFYQGTYRLTNEFVNSKDMKDFMSVQGSNISKKEAEVYDNSTESQKEVLRNSSSYMWDYSFDDKIKADVIGSNRSKSEWIEHFQDQKSHIEEVLNDNRVTFENGIEDKLHKNIEFIDKNIKTLLDKWENTEPSFNIYG